MFINNIEIQTLNDCINSDKYTEGEKKRLRQQLAIAIEQEKEYRERKKPIVKTEIIEVKSDNKKITMCYGKLLDMDKDKEEIERLSEYRIEQILGK